MSGVAWLLHDLWYTNLVCIDGFKSELTEKLEKKWLKVIIGHNKYEPNLDDVIIYSEAVVDSPEVTKARALAHENKKIMPIINYFQFLGEISKYFITVGFAWTNGKSSTTAMAITTGKDTIPNLWIGILGALVPQLDNESYYLNANHKNEIKSIFDFILTGKIAKMPETKQIKSLYFFVEACEYKRHFLNLDLDYSIITSLELDHTDYYKDMDDYLDAFNTLADRTKQKILIPENLKFEHEKIIKVPIKKIPFEHVRWTYNDANGSLVLALLKTLEPENDGESKIIEFKGLRRRMELLWENTQGTKIYTDYGHMASSIAWGYAALKEKYPNKKLFVIFQPHQINRILLGRNDFVKAIKPYDKAIIYDIYAARENIQELIQKFQSIHPGLNESMSLNDLWNMFAKECWGDYLTDIKDIVKEIKACDWETVIVIFSAGDIDYGLRSLDFKA